MVISDAHKGIQKAVESSFLGASWQYCQVHFSRAVLESISNKGLTRNSRKAQRGVGDESKMQNLAKGTQETGTFIVFNITNLTYHIRTLESTF